MISLKDAQQNNFATSTRAELRAYAEELGLENVSPTANSMQLRKLVCSALGLAVDADGHVATAPKITLNRSGDHIFPSYNLTPNGIWQGRRHRMSIPRPEGVKIGQAEGYAWNGKHTYYIAYDEVDSVPEPIFNIIATNKRRRAKSVRPEGGEMGELTTAWEFDAMPMNYLGLDEETRNRAGSLQEWYQSRGTQWFHDKSDREIQQIAQKLEVPATAWQGDKLPPRILSPEELRLRVIENLFGFADAEAPPNEQIEA